MKRSPGFLRLVGTYAVRYSIVCIVVLLCFGRPKQDWPIMILGFPLVFVPWLFEQMLGNRAEIPVFVYFLFFLANAWFWGLVFAVVHRRVERRSSAGVQYREEEPQA